LVLLLFPSPQSPVPSPQKEQFMTVQSIGKFFGAELTVNTMTPKSGFFLMASCVSAIAAVGSIFELSSGNPDLGNLTTGVILAITLPLGGLFFWAAVRSAQANQ